LAALTVFTVIINRFQPLYINRLNVEILDFNDGKKTVRLLFLNVLECLLNVSRYAKWKCCLHSDNPIHLDALLFDFIYGVQPSGFRAG
jgi:hypothetical protein